MSIVDFFLEHFPIFISMAIWREAGPAWACTIGVGAYNLLVTHSGYDLAWLPDPKTHWLHHSKQVVNFGVFLDHLFQTGQKCQESDLPKGSSFSKLSAPKEL